MLRSCKYCGRIHDTAYVCDRKPKRIRAVKETEATEFRRRNIWKQTSLEIRDRDNNICQVCLALYKANKKSPYPIALSSVSVHHIISICTDFSKALDRSNLITLCSYHHDQADRGELDADWLHDLAVSREVPPG